jgi:hypothetical protein
MINVPSISIAFAVHLCFHYRISNIKVRESSVDVAEQSPKVLEHFGAELNTSVGMQISLRCVATGSPLPSITWQMDEQTLTDRGNNEYSTDSDHHTRFQVNLLPLCLFFCAHSCLPVCRSSAITCNSAAIDSSRT